MSIIDQFDSIAAAARRNTDAAAATYQRRIAELTERVSVRAADDRHRRGVTRESVARLGAILLPADDIDLSPHTPLPQTSPIADDDSVGEGTPPAGATFDRNGQGPETATDRPYRTDSSYRSGWLTDR